MKVVVTGATGFLGFHSAHRLRQAGRSAPAGHYLTWHRLGELLEQLAGARPRKIRAPAELLRAAGRGRHALGAR